MPEYVGVNVCILRNNYPEEQMWLDLGGFVWPKADNHTDEIVRAYNERRGKQYTQSRINYEYAFVGHFDRKPYIITKGCKQIVLPFAEFMMVDGSQAVALADADYPGFYRDQNGKLLRVRFKSKIQHPILETTKGRVVAINQLRFVFEQLADYMQVILLYGEHIVDE